MTEMPPLLEVRGARCRLGQRAVFIADEFTVQRGEHWCLFGPNGAGKTVFANLLAGMRKDSLQYVQYAPDFDPVRQTFLVSFEEQQRLWQHDNRMDISEYSSDAADPGTTVAALVSFARAREDQDKEVSAALLTALGLHELRHQGIRFLSSGQVRKALLARALYGVTAAAGGLLIMDEPLESIDHLSRSDIDGVIRSALGSQFATLYLCRRRTDIPDWASHLALLSELGLRLHGPRKQVQEAAEFSALISRQPLLPSRLPPASRVTPESGSPDDTGRINTSHDDTTVAEKNPLLQLRDVRASYADKPVLVDLNWTLRAGEHVLIEGPNGCGKSTLLSLIDGENHKGYGQDVTLFGKPKGSGESVWEIKRFFGVVSNELHNKYVKGWRVLDVVVSGFYDSVGLYDDSGGKEREAARDWLAVVTLADQEKSYYHELSFGQQRLVLLARAMVKQPRILVLDEPCVGLDDYHRALILKLLDAIAGQTSTQLIYVSHVVGEQPACINRRYHFVPVAGGGHTLVERNA